jgi:hypothetical protein
VRSARRIVLARWASKGPHQNPPAAVLRPGFKYSAPIPKPRCSLWLPASSLASRPAAPSWPHPPPPLQQQSPPRPPRALGPPLRPPPAGGSSRSAGAPPAPRPRSGSAAGSPVSGRHSSSALISAGGVVGWWKGFSVLVLG